METLELAAAATLSSDMASVGASATHQQPRNGEPIGLGAAFDEEFFPQFAPLLVASRDYARHTGFRFRSNSFDGIDLSVMETGRLDALPIISEARARDSGLRLAGKIQAAPAVRVFATRLVEGDLALADELDRAFQIVISESNRNAMISTCKEVGVFPPSPPPAVNDADCSYEDCSASFTVIAQRLYNDEVRRLCDCNGQLKLRARTAAFIVDFAEQVGAALPQMPEDSQSVPREFAAHASEWAAQDRISEGVAIRDTLRSGLDKLGASADQLFRGGQKLWTNNLQPALVSASIALARD